MKKHIGGSVRLLGTILKDFFRLGKKTDSQYSWCRFPLSVKNKTEQNRILKLITKAIKEKQKIENENNKG